MVGQQTHTSNSVGKKCSASGVRRKNCARTTGLRVRTATLFTCGRGVGHMMEGWLLDGAGI